MSMIGKKLAHYEIISQLGQGGMGEVFLAHDTSLDRKVAVKFLPEPFELDETAHKRFMREARSAAALDHPYICSIHEIGQAEGRSYIVMEYVEGPTLKDRLAQGEVPLKDAMQWSVEIAEALAVAHKKGIIHRDLKPSNIMISRTGHAKVMDFGLAKQLYALPESGSQEETLTGLTREGTTVGTIPYMSPEQTQGKAVDYRSDLFSFGIVIYEILSGVNPFKRENSFSTADAICRETPPSLSACREDVPQDIEDLVGRLLAKEPTDRIQQARGVEGVLKKALNEISGEQIVFGRETFSRLRNILRKPVYLIPLIIILAGIVYFSVQGVNTYKKGRWAREAALPEIERLIEEDNYREAFTLASQAERYIPEDFSLTALWPRIAQDASFRTEPAGAGVYYKIDSDKEKEETYLGLTPVEKARLPKGSFWLRIEKAGYETVEALIPGLGLDAPPDGLLEIKISLDAEGSIPPGMVRIPQSTANMLFLVGVPTEFPSVPSYLIDKHEVTNRDYKNFVDQGGYENQEYWEHDFVKEGRVLSFEEAMEEFRDPTGRSGPSAWEEGGFPEGEEDYPVSGVSWYEAAAYAKFTGKSLPTIYHWVTATNLNLATYIVPTSNFGNQGPRTIASGLVGARGTYDMAGNVKEWCWNASEDQRFILGGGWSEPSYMFYFADAQSPFDRSETYGFRCIQYLEIDDTARENFLSEIPLWYQEDSIEKPVSDEAFEIIKSLYAYDQNDLEADREPVDESSPYWTRERITFRAAYGNDRVVAYLYIPKDGTDPFQTVVYFPGLGAQFLPSVDSQVPWINFIIKNGRAVLYPIYKATHDRIEADFNLVPGTKAQVDYTTYWIKDLRRSVDYLETREDIDMERLAYYGFSWGSTIGSIALALEDRFDIGIFLDGGLTRSERQGINSLNFAPRVHIPILMLNGVNDSVLPLETTQKPLYDLLGTPAQDKKKVDFECGHSVLSFYRHQGIREILDWLDYHFGKPQ